MGKNHKYALVTLKTGFALARKVKTKRAERVATAIITALKPLRRLVRTITFDNGLEFAQHARITPEHLQHCQATLKNRARKRLAWLSPAEALLSSAKRAGVAL